MKKKILGVLGVLALICIIVFGIILGGKYLFERELEKAKALITNEAYEEAIEAFSKLEDSKFKGDKIFNEQKILEKIIEIESLFNRGELNRAKESLKEIHEDYKNYEPLKIKVKSLENKINKSISEREKITKKIKELKECVEKKALKRGRDLAKVLKGENLDKNQKKEVKVLEDILIKFEKDKIEAEKKLEEIAKNKTLSVAEAKRRVLEEDSINLNEWLNSESGVTWGYDRIYAIGSLNLPTQKGFYRFYVSSQYCEVGTYLVDIGTGAVYRGGNQGGMPIYLVSNNQIVKTYPQN